MVMWRWVEMGRAGTRNSGIWSLEFDLILILTLRMGERMLYPLYISRTGDSEPWTRPVTTHNDGVKRRGRRDVEDSR